MTIDELPILELFNRLREAGLPLGINEYQLLLRSLQGGFGIRDRASLKRLCQTLWVKSTDDRQILDYYFELMILEEGMATSTSTNLDSQASRKQTKPRFQSNKSQQAREKSTPAKSAHLKSKSSTSNISRELTLEIEDLVRLVQVLSQATTKNNKIPNNNSFISTKEYFPVNVRQMKQTWRYLRRRVKMGQLRELDLEATVEQIGKQGMYLKPVLMPDRVNQTKLLLLIDQDGSMMPFHSLSRLLTNTALEGGHLGKTSIYYFHNCPLDYLYHDSNHQEAESISNIISHVSKQTVVLIVSDAGAARGGYNQQRIELTKVFFKQLKKKICHIAWLNPMPRERWQGTTAAKIAGFVPMFEVSHREFQYAIKALKGA